MGRTSQRKARALHPTNRRPRKFLRATGIEWIMLLALVALIIIGAYGFLTTDHRASSQSDLVPCQSTSTVPAPN